MKKLAIDIVLLPPPAIADLAIELCRKLDQSGEKEISLGAEMCLPHITLAMGGVLEEDLPELERRLAAIAVSFSPLNLAVTEAYHREASALVISETPELQRLHEQCMAACKELCGHEVSEDDFYKRSPGRGGYSVRYNNFFAEKSAYENFWPHITLGWGTGVQIDGPIDFTAETLALCHMGQTGTCGTLLWQGKLGHA